MRVRYYNPVTGRYISRDPLGYADGMNNYLYVKNNPINRIDPLGLAERDWHHLIPQSDKLGFDKLAKSQGWDISDQQYGVLLDKENHQSGVHKNKGIGPEGGKNWNDDWLKWKTGFDDKGKVPTRADFDSQVEKMINDKRYSGDLKGGLPTDLNHKEWSKLDGTAKNGHIAAMGDANKSAVKNGMQFVPGKGYVANAPDSVMKKLAKGAGKKFVPGLAIVFAISDFNEGGVGGVLMGVTGADIPYDLIIKPAGEWANDQMAVGDVRRSKQSIDVNDEEQRDRFLDSFGGGFSNGE